MESLSSSWIDRFPRLRFMSNDGRSGRFGDVTQRTSAPLAASVLPATGAEITLLSSTTLSPRRQRSAFYGKSSHDFVNWTTLIQGTACQGDDASGNRSRKKRACRTHCSPVVATSKSCYAKVCRSLHVCHAATKETFPSTSSEKAEV